MPRGRKKAAPFKVGDLVWASPDWDDSLKEPASVLKVGCQYKDEDDNECNDGVMVKFSVSVKRSILPPTDLTPYEEEKEDKTSSRRSARNALCSPSLNGSSKKSEETKSRALVTPSPTMAKEATEKSDEEQMEVEDEPLGDSKPASKRRGRSATKPVSDKKAAPKKQVQDMEDVSKKDTSSKKRGRSRSSSAPKKTESPYFSKKKARAKPDESEDDEEEDVTLMSLKKPASKTPSKKTAAKKPAAKKPAAKKPATKKPATKKKPTAAAKKKKVELIVADDEAKKEAESSSDEGEDVGEDSEDDDDKPFKAEYATSGRATCRRCDEIISKGALRVSHVPLFRGKPGFRVYRHPQCIVFSEQVQCVQDIGGWRTIKKTSRKDFELLCLRVEESKIEVQKENEELEPDELVQKTFQGEIRKAPPGLTASLLPFQVEGVSWMYHQETQLPELHGGILADEMGMGKTLQTITTILDNRPLLQHSKPGAKHPPALEGTALTALKRESELWDKSVGEWTHEMEMNNIPKKMWPKKQYQSARAGTLVICPVIALTQWKAELEKFTEPGTFSIATYHGPNRAKEYPLQKLIKYDIVLTTYQVLEADFRKMVSPNKVTCPNCGGKFKIDKLRIHLTYFCGEGAQRTEAQARQQRTADRPNRGGDGGGNGRGGGGKGPKKKKAFEDEKKAPMTATKSKTKQVAGKKKAPPKKRSSKKEDSESDDEDPEEEVETTPSGRPSRSAAKTASRRMSSSMNEWTGGAKGGNSDDESFGSDDNESEGESDDEESVMSYDEEDSEGEAIPSKKRPKKKPARKAPPKKKAAPRKKQVEADNSESESSEEEDSPALARARKRQQAALEQAKKGKGKKGQGKKSFEGKAKANNKGKAKAKGKAKKKKFDDDDYSSSDESDDGAAGPNQDPLAGIDLQELMKEAMEGSQMSLLHSICWWRVVLDEAHMIKSRSSQTAAAAFALIGINRWALSGTPLQNRVGELYSLIRFIRIDPMAHYFCRSKGCDCKSIHYRIKNGTCLDCGHRGFQHFSHFNKHVLNPIQRDGYSGDGRRAMFMLKNEVLDKCLLRRTKETRAEDMNLPPRIVTIRTINLHPIERDFYDALYTQTKSSFSDYVAQGTLLNNYAHIFDLLTRMRQAVDHPYLIVYSKRNCEAAANSAGASGNQPQVANGSTDCELCHEPPTGRVLSSCCGAAFCRSCVMDYMTPALEGTGEGSTPCPSCRAPFSIDFNQASAEVEDEAPAPKASKNESRKYKDNAEGELGPSLSELKHITTGSILRRINLAEFATSTKIEALVQELVEMRKARPGSKALVFSQFVNMLDLIRWRLHSDPGLAEMGLGARILHGAMDRKSRDAALNDFREDGSVRVLLMSLKAGGVALNLTVASEVFLVDNWWNPAAEMQAIDRTHRLGQHRCIRAVRFIAEGTVEERVLQLQEKKRLVFDGTVGRDAGSLKMLTVDDMHSLFQ